MQDHKSKSGFLVLAALILLTLAANSTLISQIDPPQNSYNIFLTAFLTGSLVAQFGIVTFWVVLSRDHLVRRVSFLFCAWLMLAAAFMIGFLLTLNTSKSLSIESSDMLRVIAGYSPIFLLAAMTPILLIRLTGRTLLRHRGQHKHDEQRHREYRQERKSHGSYSIAGIMAFTGLVALAFGGIELSVASLLGESADQRWYLAGPIAGAMFGVSLLVFVPVFLFLFFEKFWMGLLIAVVHSFVIASITTAVFIGIDSDWRSISPERLAGYSLLFATSGCLICLILFVAGLRQFGFRMHKSKHHD